MKSSIRFFLALTLLSFASSAKADFIAYNVPVGTPGNQDGFTLGLDFQVASPITITQLGLFDAGGDGFVGRLNVRLYDITNINTPILLMTAAFGPSPSNQGNTLIGGGASRYLAPTLIGAASLGLTVGKSYSIVADGFTPADQNGNYNPAVSSIAPQIIATGLRYNSGIVGLPTAIDSGPPNKYLAGTFAFVPEPGSIVLMGLGIVGMVGYGLRKKAHAST